MFKQNTRRIILITFVASFAVIVLAGIFIFLAADQTAAAPAAGTTFYVDKDAAPGGDGTTWVKAYQHLQDGLGAANNFDEIWVAEGVYYPDEGAAVSDGDRAAKFKLRPGMKLYGGFAGGESSLFERKPGHPTILSGDIDQNGNSNNNSYHVVTNAISGAFDLIIIDGVTIKDGNADGGSNPDDIDNSGGGVLIDNAVVTLSHVVVTNNQAAENGAGIEAIAGAKLTLQNTVVDSNRAPEGSGGGILCVNCRVVRLFLSSVTNNTAVLGAGISIERSENVSIDRSTISANSSRGIIPKGGGIFLKENRGDKLIVNSLISGNVVDNTGFSGDYQTFGGGLYIEGYGDGQTKIINSTISGNRNTSTESSFGGALMVIGEELKVVNSAIWNNFADEQEDAFIVDADEVPKQSAAFSYTLLQSGCPNAAACDNIIEKTDPQFVAPISPSDAPASSGNFRLKIGSPAVNSGDNNGLPAGTLHDLDGNARIAFSTVDMGAFELQLACPAPGTTRLMVDKTASGANTGLSWSDGLNNLQDALIMEHECAADIEQIWVAQGTYYPDEGAYQVDGDRSAAFRLLNGLAIYGGFLGNETALSQRNPWHYITTLSGDIDQDDNTDAHHLVETPADIAGDNSYHVATGNGTDSSAMLDGFAITGGQANGKAADKEHEGGGIFIQTGSPTLINLAFSGNIALEGGAMALVAGSDPAITDTRFVSNAAGDYGGALHNEHSDPNLTNVLFSGNRAANGGGAIYNLASSPELTNVTISGNAAGGTVPLASLDPYGLQVAASGGGIFNLATSNPKIQNSIIWNNEDDSGKGTPSATIHNQDPGSTPTADHSDIQQLASINQLIFDGTSIDQDPLFVVPVDPASAPFFGGDLHLKGNSPAIDTGKDSFNSLPTDLDGEQRIQGAAIDMGPFETTPAPDISVHKSSDTPTAKVGDTVNYAYEVVNTGLVPVSGLTASDDLLGTITLSGTTIAAGASVTGTLSHVVVSGDLPGPIINTATVTGTVGASTTVVATDTLTVSLSSRPLIEVEVTANPSSALPGETVTYQYLVKNVGDVELNTVALSDSRLGAITLGATTLAPNASTTGSATYVVLDSDLPGPLTNTAVASGVSPTSTTVQDSDTVHVSVINPFSPTDMFLPVIANYYPPATPTPTPTNTPTITPTPSPTPTKTPSPITCQNIVGNSGFEDSSAWVLETTAYTAAYTTVQWHTGARSVRTGIFSQASNIFSYSSAMQTVTIPSDATKADLTYYLWPQSTETSLFKAPAKALDLNEKDALNASDVQLVLILDTHNNELARLYGQRRNDQTWIFGSDDLMAFKGQTIKLYFGTFNNGRWNQGVTGMYVDDVELEVCAPN